MSSGSLPSARKASVMISRISARTPAAGPATARARFIVAIASVIFFCLARAWPRSRSAGARARLSPEAALDHIAKLDLGALELPAREQLAPELGLDEERARGRLDQGLVVALGGVEVLQIEANGQQGARGLLDLGGDLEQGRAASKWARAAALVALIRLELREREDRRGVARPLGDGGLVGLDRLLGPPILLVDPGEGHAQPPGVGPARGGAFSKSSTSFFRFPSRSR